MARQKRLSSTEEFSRGKTEEVWQVADTLKYHQKDPIIIKCVHIKKVSSLNHHKQSWIMGR